MEDCIFCQVDDDIGLLLKIPVLKYVTAYALLFLAMLASIPDIGGKRS